MLDKILYVHGKYCFHKMRNIFLAAEQPLAFKERLHVLVSWFVG